MYQKKENPMSRADRARLACKAYSERVHKEYINNPNYCLYCNSPILPKIGQKVSEVKKKKFCNSSCAAKKNNLNYKGKHGHYKLINPTKSFCLCGNKKIYTSSQCIDCYRAVLGNKTIKETFRTGPDKYRRIRDHARNLYKYLLTHCESCGYNKHVEVCHIKPIKDFPLDTLVSVVNDKANIKILCPNCHWEFDNIK